MSAPTVPTLVVYQAPPRNMLGNVAIVLAMVGWVTCGVFCLLGAMLGVIALFAEPRMSAIFAVVIGTLGTIVWMVLVTVLGL